MATPPEIADEDIRLLDELSGLGMAMARDFQGRCLTVGEAREAADLALGFQRSARSVRQCIALKAKLLRDRVRFGREDQEHAARETESRMAIRKAQVRRSVERAIWDDDGPEAERLVDELDDILEVEAFNDDFAQGSAHTHIARICQDLGVTPPASSGDSAIPRPADGEPRRSGLSSESSPPLFERAPSPDGGGEEDAGPDELVRRSSA